MTVGFPRDKNKPCLCLRQERPAGNHNEPPCSQNMSNSRLPLRCSPFVYFRRGLSAGAHNISHCCDSIGSRFCQGYTQPKPLVCTRTRLAAFSPLGTTSLHHSVVLQHDWQPFSPRVHSSYTIRSSRYTIGSLFSPGCTQPTPPGCPLTRLAVVFARASPQGAVSLRSVVLSTGNCGNPPGAVQKRQTWAVKSLPSHPVAVRQGTHGLVGTI